MIEISIPVKKHIRKFLIKRYGQTHKVSKTSFLGVMILELINGTFQKPEKFIKITASYTLQIPELYYNTKGFNIDQKKALFISNCLEKLFTESFHEFVDTQIESGRLNAYDSVKTFKEIYNISESDFKLESLYKSYQRHCGFKIKDKKNNKKR